MTSIALNPPDHPHSAARTDPRAHSWRQVCRRHAYIVPSFAVCLLVCAWFVTWGDWKFFERETFCGFYDAQARAILHGRLDVPPKAIGFEAFIFRGKTYGYFAVGPALLRMPLAVLFSDMDGRWSRLIMLTACLVNLLCAYRLLLFARGGERIQTGADRLLNSLFILCAGIGSTNVFMVNRSYTYHEAIMLGGMFALLFTVLLIRYLQSPSGGTLAWAGVCAFFSFHSRATAGSGALLALCLLAGALWLRGMGGNSAGRSILGLGAVDRPLRHACVAGLAALLTVAVYFGVNYGKFRTFDGVPVKYYGLYHSDPRRMQITGGRQIHPENIPTGIATYFGVRGARFDRLFPWIYMSAQPSVLGHPAIDAVEQYSSIPVSMPALGLLALLGAAGVASARSQPLRQLRLPMLCMMAGGGIILMTVGITERYLHDLYPFLILAAAAGVARVAAGKNVRNMTGGLALLALVSIALNCAFALEYQRLAVWGIPSAKRNEMIAVQHSVNAFLHLDAPAPAGDAPN